MDAPEFIPRVERLGLLGRFYMRPKSFEYDLVISFAGEDREIAEIIATYLRQSGVKVFYDRFQKSDLWGKDLFEYLAEVYGKKARYCLMIISKNYPLKKWPKHERRSAQERQLQEPREYILPLKVDDVQVPGLLSTIGYLNLQRDNLESICKNLLIKLKQKNSQPAELEVKSDFIFIQHNQIKFDIKIINNMDYAVIDTETMLDYNKSFFSLDGRITQHLGTIKPNSESVATYYIKPDCCIHRELIGGEIFYKDISGKKYILPIPPKEVHYICLFLKKSE